jgi:heme-degrading monooxygenase HmoA
MIAVMNRIPVNMEHAEAFEERFANRASTVDGMPGFISFQLMRPTKEDDPYIVLTYWETEEDFHNWTNSKEFKEGHAQSSTLPENTFRGHPVLEVHEIIQNTAKIERLAETEAE